MTKFSKTFTLDLDNVSIREAKNHFHKILATEKGVIHASLTQSPLKGYHITIELDHAVDNWAMRDKWHDDGNRLVYEILGNPEGIRTIDGREAEFFWTGKMILDNKINPVVEFEETPVEEIARTK